MENKLDFKTVADAALNAVDNLLAEWLPSGKYKGHEFFALNPTRADKRLGSFAVNTHSGAWADYATNDAGGDLVSLYAYLFCNGRQGDALKAVAERLRIGNFGAVERKEWDGTPNYGNKKPRQNWTAIMPFEEDRLNLLSGAKCYRYALGRKTEGLRAVYRDAAGAPLCVVQRFIDEEGRKADLPFVWAKNDDGVQAWANRRPAAPTPLFGLDALAAKPDARVLVVEGEKCRIAADAYFDLHDWAVVSWIGGCNGWNKADWSAVVGRDVVLWPDADSQRRKLSRAEVEAGMKPEDAPLLPFDEQPGRKAMLGIASLLHNQECTVHIVNTGADLTGGYDIADVISDTEPLVSVREMLGRTEAFPAPLAEGVPEETHNTADEVKEHRSAGGMGADDADINEVLAGMLADLVLIEGKVKAFNIKKGVEYSKGGMIAVFGQENFDRWLASPQKKVRTQAEINREKKSWESIHALKDAEEDVALKDAVGRYIYLDGTSTAWDSVRDEIVTREALAMALGDGYKVWANNPARRSVWKGNLLFAPGKTLPEGYINMYRGLPLEKQAMPAEERARLPQWWKDLLDMPEFAKCRPICDMLSHLCGGDDLKMQYTLCWLAYPLQNPGAKMNTALVFHGDVHGAGKSWLFDTIMREIYGVYSATLGQKDLESTYTANRSRKLYVVFEEIFNNKQKYDQTGMMKHMITGKTMQVERKFVDSFEEENHINCVFLSNEAQPFKIEENDRRYFVVWPEKRLPDNLKAQVLECISDGGILNFYNLLLSFPLVLDYDYAKSEDGEEWKAVETDFPRRFDGTTIAPMTKDKQNVIAYGRSSWQTFFHAWKNGQIDGIPFCACTTKDLWRLFDWWCREENEHKLGKTKFLHNMATKMPRARRNWRFGGAEGKEIVFKPNPFNEREGEAEMDAIGRQIHNFRACLDKMLDL